MITVAMWNMHPLPTIFYAVTLLDLSALLCISTSVAMATLPKRVVKLEEVVLGSVATGALVTRVQHLEVCCLGSAAAGPLPQRLDKLEEATGCTAGDGAAVAVDAAPAPEADEVADAAASTQATESHPWALVIVQICLYSMFLQPSKIG